MIVAVQQHWVFPPSVPTALVYLLAAAAVAAWVLVHRLLGGRARSVGARLATFAAAVLAGFVAMLAVAQALQRGLVLATNWPLWPIALIGAAAVEIVLALYSLERRTVSRRAGVALAAMRVIIIVLVITMLAQPVRPWNLEKTIQRFVAVLVDTSASMYLPDTQLAAWEKMRLAWRFAEGVSRPYALDRAAEQLTKIQQELAAHAEALASVSSMEGDVRRRQLEVRRDALAKRLQAAEKTIADQAAAIAAPLQGNLRLPPQAVVDLGDVRKRLSGVVADRLKEATSLASRENARNLERDHSRLLQAIRQAASEVGEAAAKTAAAAQAIDDAAYASLSADRKARVDAAAARNRLALAEAVLMGRPPATPGEGQRDKAEPSLLETLQKRYSVKLYTFASAPAEVDLKAYAEAYAKGETGKGEAASLPAEQQQTDFASAFEKVLAEMTDKQLSGILMLTDGRHTAAKSVEPMLRRLAVQQVPVSTVLVGSDKPPLDAGVLSVEAPEAVAAGDRVFMNVEVKLDGLAGKEVRVALSDAEKVVDSRTVRVPTDSYRARVQLADEPSATGLHRYVVEVQKFDGEVLGSNNQYPLAVSVSDDRTRLLLIDGRPRWEFRYIKNLFASRDKTVRLQYVLLEPDRIEGVPQPPRVEASVSRPLDEVEATALPKDESEWMKFDAIILGDVPSRYLGTEELRILRKFVTERGGTLVVIAGPNHMPHAYAETPLADLLPVTITRIEQPYVPSPDKSFRVALTAEGQESVIMRQKMEADENLEVWNSLPDIFWRHPAGQAKQGATVLAYALPPTAPAFMPRPGAPDETVPEDVLRQRREFEREHSLIVHHNVALGKVMYLGFDHTWRLRYRVGDPYHHRFWGQVLRWATAGKLPAGTETVKLGTDRTRYPPHAPVTVRAKIAKKDYSPVVSDDVAVNVLAGDRAMLRKKLQYVENSAGMYVADLGTLPSGTYKVELDAPAARPILAEDNVDRVAVEFSVDPATPAEQAELAPDRGFVSRLANLTGGTVADPVKADRVLDGLGPASEVEIEKHEYVIWDSWPLFAVVILTATAEWLLRKKVGLA